MNNTLGWVLSGNHGNKGTSADIYDDFQCMSDINPLSMIVYAIGHNLLWPLYIMSWTVARKYIMYMSFYFI